jgi:hypothetical protein
MAVELVQESAYTAAELEAYDQYLDALRVQQTLRADSFVEGKVEVAKRMIRKNRPLEEVCEMTELSAEVVGDLVREISEDGEKAD